MAEPDERNPCTDRLRAILVERLGWYGKGQCPVCGAQVIHTVLDSFNVTNSPVMCRNGHNAIGGDLGFRDKDPLGYRNLFQDGIKLAAMIFGCRTSFSLGSAVVMAHTAVEGFLRAVVEHARSERKTVSEEVERILKDEKKAELTRYIKALDALGLAREELLDSKIRWVSRLRNQFVHGVQDCSEEDTVDAFERIADVFVQLGTSGPLPEQVPTEDLDV